MSSGTRTVYSGLLNKVFRSEFNVGYPEDRRAQHPKHCDSSTNDEDNTANINSVNNNS